MFSHIIAGCMKWGVWGANYNAQQMLKLIEQSIEIGVTTFDHADIYGHYTTEATFGEALAIKPHMRDKMRLISKCGIKLVTPNRPDHQLKSYDTSFSHIIQSTEQSLRNLKTDYLDLLLFHRPSPLMRAEEIAAAFTHLRSAGKVLSFGVSNFLPWQVNLLRSVFPDLRFNQIEISALHREPFLDGSLDHCQQHFIQPMAWSPLGGGSLFSKEPDAQAQRIHAAAKPIQERLNAGLDQILIAWLMKHPTGIWPVLGTSKFERLEKAVQAMEMKLTQEEWFSIWEAAAGVEVP